ncbi:MAG: VOC family protein [Gemmatimonadetes bacterium]|jgi:catechol 2,3-dioxygenase-like lactoylglutathione lyase family enzyme|nr:VOC family protein [Gemmatimonadota bacterium]
MRRRIAAFTRRALTGSLLVALVAIIVASITAFAPARQAPLSPRFNHVMLYVSNLETSIAFYTSAFDLQVSQRIGEMTVTGPDGTPTTRQVKMALLKFPGQDFVLELAERSVENGGASPHLQHLGVDVRDIAAAAERLQKAGGRDFSGIRTVRTMGTVAKNTFFKGPDGESVELMELVSGEF